MASNKEVFYAPITAQKTVTNSATTIYTVTTGFTFYLEGIIISGDGTNQVQVQIKDDTTVKIISEIPAASTISFQTFRIPFSTTVVAICDANTAEITVVGFELTSGP